MGSGQIYQNATTTVMLHGAEVKVHALCTGTVSVKQNFRKRKGIGPMSKFNILLGNRYTEYLPIWVYVIEHPDGLIVVDTGENSRISRMDEYLANESAFTRIQFRHAARFQVEERDELDIQFSQVGLSLQDVKLVVLTHLHLDHTDGLKFFSKSEILVGANEFKHPHFNMPTTYPKWFRPNTVDYKVGQIDVFDKAFAVSSSGNLFYFPTPGHTFGHSSLLFRTDHFDLIFAGDSSYSQEQLVAGELAGVNVDFSRSKETCRQIKAYAARYKSIFLPSHDGKAGERLLEQRFLSNSNF